MPRVAREPEKPDSGAGEAPKRIFAKKFVVPVRKAPDGDSERIGYLRAGSVLMAKTARPVGDKKCRGGWYELETGGFVCNKRDVIAFQGEKLPERRSTQPDLKARLPYAYGRILRDRTAVYRRLPTGEEVTPGKAERGIDQETEPAEAVAQPTPEATPAGAEPGPGGGADGEEDESAGAERPDAGPPTLADLAGNEEGLIERWLMKGFHIALDRELERTGRRYWQTQANGFIDYDKVRTVSGTEFQGLSLETGEWSLPLGYVLSSKTSCYRLDARGRLRRAEKPGYHHAFRLAEEREIRGTNYYISDDERYFRARTATRIDARDPPRNVGEDEKWIDVDLSAQSLVAYVGARPVYVTLISSGRVDRTSNPPKDFATPTGSFRIERKHLTYTMDGDTAVDGPYSVEDVPYVMYFQLAYALHSAFWHNGFGRPRSHGCINMAPLDAQWLFNWISPELPPGWHVAYPSREQPGTRLYVRGETPAG